MNTKRALTALVALFCASGAFATSFIVPSDAEMVRKSKMIVIGTVEGSLTQWGDEQSDARIETIYEIRVQRAPKGGAAPNSLIRVTSPGGEMDDFGVYVPGAAQFVNGERVLLFLSPHKNHLDVTDLMLGKFRAGTSSRGTPVFVRETDEDGAVEIAGRRPAALDRVRTESGFIRFIERRVAGADAEDDYFVEPAPATASPASAKGNLQVTPNLYPTSAERYTQMGSSSLGVKWDPVFMTTSGEPMNRRTCPVCDVITGTDPVIANAFAAWNGECGSAINLVLGAPVTTAAQAGVGQSFYDTINVIEFNDPQGFISGTWTGSGTIALTFITFTTTTTSFVDPNFRELLDADIVFQDGYTSGQLSFPTAMTHETGHALGFRHSNASPASPNDPTNSCNSMTDDCTTADGSAVMFYRVLGAGVGFTLQTWDQHAAQTVYPGGSCAAVPAAPTGVNARATAATSVLITWNAVVGATSYEVYRRAAGTGFLLRGSPTTNSFTDSASADAAYLYLVRAVNASGSSTDSASDLATTVIFAGDPLVAGVTIIRAVHLAELRTAVDAVRLLASLSAGTYTDAASAGVPIKAIHINQLRTQLDAAFGPLGLSVGGYTDTLSTGVFIRAIHFQELRNRVK